MVRPSGLFMYIAIFAIIFEIAAPMLHVMPTFSEMNFLMDSVVTSVVFLKIQAK